MAKRRAKQSALELEDQHCQRPWSGLREQWRLEQQHHTPEENKQAHAQCRALVDGGLSLVELWEQK